MTRLKLLTSLLTLFPRLLFDLDDPVGVSEVFPPRLRRSYDFIVVGSGSAGAVVAARLSEARGVSVLLLEAGGDGTLLSLVPAGVGATLNTALDWQYRTRPDPARASCLGMFGGSCLWHAGRVLGGGSSINGMLYVRGDQADYNAWEQAGNPGWGWESVLAYFKKSERQTNARYAEDTRHHGTAGPLSVSDLRYRTPLSSAFVRAGAGAGLPVRDLNTGNSTGVTVMQTMMRAGKRHSAATAFLKPVLGRPNLTVLTHALVEKILFVKTKDGRVRADQVIFTRFGEKMKMRATKEIIVSAGVVETPKLLLLSGIGPRQQLENLGIPVTADLPVGENMQSHVGTGDVVFTLNAPVSFNPLRLFTNPLNLLAYWRGEGPLAAVSGFEGMALYRSGLEADAAWPDIQLNLISLTPAIDGGLVYRRSLNLNDQTYEKYKPLAFQEGFFILPVLLHPKSRGQVSLRSRDPADPPIIDPNYLSHPLDLARLVRAVRFSQQLGTSSHFRQYGAQFYSRPISQVCCRIMQR